MISYLKAIKKIRKNKIKIHNENVLIKNSLNRICAKNIYSPSMYPPADNAAFDGYALVSKETNFSSHNLPGAKGTPNTTDDDPADRVEE